MPVQTTGPILCPHCGGVIPAGAPRCPYCGSAYTPEAEKEYMRKLHGVRGQLGEVANVGKEASRKEIKRLGRRVARIVAAVLVLAAVAAGIVMVRHARENARNRREYEWRANALPEMNELFEKGDYDALLEKFEEAQNGEHDLYNWEHYTFCDIYGDTKYAEAFRDGYEKGYFTKNDAEQYLFILLKFRTISMRERLPEKDREILKEYTQQYEEDLKEIYGMSDEEIKTFEQDIAKNYGYPSYEKCAGYVAEHPEIIMEEAE
ncbi:MAG: zinc ribbon domain-containing protein [Lachnospiraceae bacterium]|nr:zinc ribbon domain-containing protein [Lachnospiraceae bacterium]